MPSRALTDPHTKGAINKCSQAFDTLWVPETRSGSLITLSTATARMIASRPFTDTVNTT